MHGISTSMLSVCLIVVAVLSLSLPLNALGQEKPKLGLVIEDLSERAKACGLAEATIEPLAVLTLRNNGIEVSKTSDFPFYLYIRATGGHIKARDGSVLGCVFSLDIAVERGMHWTTGTFRPRKPAALRLCQSSSLDAVGKSDNGKTVFEEIEQHIKLCLGQLDYSVNERSLP